MKVTIASSNMFSARQRQASPVRLSSPPTKESMRNSQASRPNAVWHDLATGVRVSQPHEPAEREADRVAEAFVHGRAVAVQNTASDGSSVHRRCAECEDEHLRQTEETRLQAKRESGSERPTTGDAPHLTALEGHGQPLSAALRGDFELRFGRDFSDVRVHTDATAGESANAFDALAYTYGRHLVFGAGEFDTSSSRGRRLIAHELTHVAQQSSQARPLLQRQGKDKPRDPQPDVCITLPVVGTLCGQAAADACKKLQSIPGCSLVCKVFDCSKPEEPKTLCPPGWRAATSKDFEGQCCRGTIDNVSDCCTPDRIALLDFRCCGENEVVSDNHCKKSEPQPLPPDLLCPFGPRTLLGECCLPPMVSKGLFCGLRDVPHPTPPKPQPMLPRAIDILFKLDRPHEGETAAALASATTTEGKASFDALATSLKADPGLKVQIVGRASPEGTEAYNLELGARRARLVAEAFKSAGISESQIADPPVAELRAECKPLGPGLVTCGEAGATGASDREVMARVFQGSAP
jgi:hypothetical protein